MSLFGQASLGTNIGNQSQAQAQTAPDVPIVSPPSDTVTSLNFTPVQNANFMVATSWSGQVQCWDTGIQGHSVGSQPKAETKHEYVLDSDWFHDGSKVVTCGCDKAVKLWDLASNQQMPVGTHDAPIKAVCVLDPSIGGGSLIVTGGWDNKIKYWDVRTRASIGEVALESKVYAMDARERLLVVGTGEQPHQAGQTALTQQSKPPNDRTRKIYCFNLQGNPTAPMKVEPSPLQYQTRCVAAFPQNAGYLVGSIEGRVGVQNFDGMHPDKQPSYTFKCHRRTLDMNGNVVQSTKTQYPRKDVYDEVHSVNVIRFHPAGTFMTAGSDGVHTFWDKDEKARLVKPNAAAPLPINAAAYNSAGSIFAYALGYDWGQGHEYYDPTNANNAPRIMMHKLDEKEYQRRAKTKR